MKKGFTLIEMMAVILIIAALALLILPNITDQLGNKKENINKVTKQIILTAAEMYKNDNNSNSVITVQDLIDENYLDSNFNDNTETITKSTEIDLEAMCVLNDSDECIN